MFSTKWLLGHYSNTIFSVESHPFYKAPFTFFFSREINTIWYCITIICIVDLDPIRRYYEVGIFFFSWLIAEFSLPATMPGTGLVFDKYLLKNYEYQHEKSLVICCKNWQHWNVLNLVFFLFLVLIQRFKKWL